MTNYSCLTKLILSFIMIVTAVFESNANFGKYPIQNFTPEDYKAGIQNIDFAQNRDMTIFIANNLGVLAYDGSDWKVHAFQNGKKQRSLAFDAQLNRLYIGSQGDFGFFEDDWKYSSLIELVPPANRSFDEVWDVFIHDSKIYFCTFQYIYVYDGESIVVIDHPNAFDRSFLVEGRLLTQNQKGELLEIKDGSLTPVFSQNQKNQIIAGIVPRDEGYLVFYNSGQIDFSSSFTSSNKYHDLAKALQGTFVNHVLQLSDSRLAISTQTAGLFLYDFRSGAIEQLTTENGLEANACLRSFQDYNGNLWLGMQNGISLVHINSPLRLVNQEIKLQGSGYEAYDNKAGRYFSTSNGIYLLTKGSSEAEFLTGTEGPAYGIQEIAGKLYAGHHTGLFLLDGLKATRIATTDGLWQLRQLRNHPDRVIAGTYSGLYLFEITEQKKLIPIGRISGFDESSRFFEEDHTGKILVGQYYKGLYQLELSNDATEVSVSNLSEISESPIQDQIILGKIDNELYLGTNKGIYVMNQSLNKISSSALLSKEVKQDPIYLIKQDQYKNIHIITDSKVGFFKQISGANYVFVPSSLYQQRYYLNNDLLHASVHLEEGIMFSANEGFLYYNPELEERVTTNKAVVINKVRSINQNITLYQRNAFEARSESPAHIEFDHKTKAIQISVESFHFKGANNQHYRYQLVGFDESFGEWTDQNSKEYSNLQDGDYEFIAQTQNYLGEITESLPLHIRVKPPLLRSTGAKILYLLIALGAFIFVSRLQKHRYKKKSKKIEEKRKVELREKEAELVKIEKQKEHELSQLEAEKVESELAHLSNLLAASTMNLVVKNEFIENIKAGLKDIRKKGKHEETKQALERIEREIDTTLKLQEDWNQFEYHFNQVHGGFLNRLREEFTDLSPNDQKLCAFLRLNLNTKEIANLMNISLRGVEVARYRLRKKILLEKGQNLSKFIMEY